MTFDSLILFGKRLLDVLLVWLVFYYILKSLRKNVKMILLFKGILFIVVLKIVSDVLDLVTIGYLLDYVIMWGPLALIIIFQPEIRNVLEQLGRSQLLGRHKVLTVDEREKMVYEIIQAVDYLKKAHIGALIDTDTQLFFVGGNGFGKKGDVVAGRPSDIEFCAVMLTVKIHVFPFYKDGKILCHFAKFPVVSRRFGQQFRQQCVCCRPFYRNFKPIFRGGSISGGLLDFQDFFFPASDFQFITNPDKPANKFVPPVR